jgi:hypothetical protein
LTGWPAAFSARATRAKYVVSMLDAYAPQATLPPG